MEKEYTIRVISPVDCTEQQLDEWVEFQVGHIGSMSVDNPLCEYDIEASSVS